MTWRVQVNDRAVLVHTQELSGEIATLYVIQLAKRGKVRRRFLLKTAVINVVL